MKNTVKIESYVESWLSVKKNNIKNQLEQEKVNLRELEKLYDKTKLSTIRKDLDGFLVDFRRIYSSEWEKRHTSKFDKMKNSFILGLFFGGFLSNKFESSSDVVKGFFSLFVLASWLFVFFSYGLYVGVAAYLLSSFVSYIRLSKKISRTIDSELENFGKNYSVNFVYPYDYNSGLERPYICLTGPVMFPDGLAPWFLKANDDLRFKVFLDFSERNEGFLSWNVTDNKILYSSQDEFHASIASYVLSRISPKIKEISKVFEDVVMSYVALQKSKARLIYLENAISEIDEKNKILREIVLPDNTMKEILNRLDMFENNDKAAPRGLLLYGPPGTGKTILAKTIAKVVNSHFISISLPDIKHPSLGQSAQNVRTIWNEARNHDRTIIFMDECEGAFGRRGSIESDVVTNEIVQAFLAEWDGMTKSNQIWVIGATNRRDLLDDAIISRFGVEVEIPLPAKDERKKIIQNELKNIDSTSYFPESVIDKTSGMSGRDISMYIKSVKSEAYPGLPSEDDFINTLQKFKKKGSTTVDESATWETLILPDNIKNQIIELSLMFEHIEALKKQNITLPKGILFYGLPGTGKTQIARTFANETKMNFIGVTTADLKAGFIGQSGQKVKELFERARNNSPCILFIDEIDVVTPARQSGDQFNAEIIAQLLQEMDGIKSYTTNVFVIAATNDLNGIDPAILSRFNFKVEIPLPSFDDRIKIVSVLLKNKKISGDHDELIALLATRTEGMSGRDLKALVDSALNKAVMRAIKGNTPDSIEIQWSDFS